MCAPITPAIALGAASFGASALGAVGQYQSAQAQANAQNAAATSNYEHQLKIRKFNWDRERFRYNRQLLQYENILDENAFAANRAYVGEQEKLNNIYKQAAFKQQANLVNLVKGSDQMAAAGRTGRSAQRLDNQLVSQFGRNQAIAAESLTGAGNAFRDRVDSIRRAQMSDNNRAYQNVAVAPMPDVAPPAPVMTPGPSPLGLIAGLGSAAFGSLTTYNELAPSGQKLFGN